MDLPRTTHVPRAAFTSAVSSARSEDIGIERETDIPAMGQNGTDNAFELHQYLALLRARKWILLSVTAAVLVVVLVFSLLQTPVYQGESRVVFEQLPQVPSSVYVPPSTLATESELAKSAQVADRVIDDLGLRATPESVLGHVTVTPVGIDSQVLVIAYSSTDPKLARDAATSFAQNYLLYRRQRAFNALQDAKRGLQAKAEDLERRIDDLADESDQAKAAGDAALAESLQADRSTFSNRLIGLNQRIDDLLPETSTNPYGQVIEPASLPTSPTSPNLSRNLVLGVLVGLILGVSAALLRERIDERLRGRDDVELAAQAPVLATVPRFDHVSPPQPVLLSDPTGAASESYRNLRTSLEFLQSRETSKAIIVTSPSVGEGKTVTTVNLAVTVAQAGGRTLLVSADLRRPTLEAYFGVSNKAGLSSWLVGLDRDLSTVIHPTAVANLDVLPSGPIPPNPAELLASPRLTDLIVEVDRAYDVVLFDCPPALPVTDGILLASRIGRALLVVNAISTRRMAVTHAREKIQGVGAKVVGAVLNGLDPSSGQGYYYESYRSQRYVSLGEAARPDAPMEKGSS